MSPKSLDQASYESFEFNWFDELYLINILSGYKTLKDTGLFNMVKLFSDTVCIIFLKKSGKG